MNKKALLAGFVLAGSFLGSYSATIQSSRQAVSTHSRGSGIQTATIDKTRTLVVNIGSGNHVAAVNGLLYAYHSLRNSRGDFGGTPYPLTVKVTFGGAGILNASSKIVHPEVRISTHPQDPVKTADVLIATLVAEGVPMLASGFALKQFDVDPTELLPGIMPGNASTHPSFIASPESNNTFIMNF